jgi:hypothetical protein
MIIYRYRHLIKMFFCKSKLGYNTNSLCLWHSKVIAKKKINFIHLTVHDLIKNKILQIKINIYLHKYIKSGNM